MKKKLVMLNLILIVLLFGSFLIYDGDKANISNSSDIVETEVGNREENQKPDKTVNQERKTHRETDREVEHKGSNQKVEIKLEDSEEVDQPNGKIETSNINNTNNKENVRKNNKSSTTKQNQEKVIISGDKIERVENSLTLEDKVKAVKLILSRLSPSDIKLLKELVSGGLTQEEKEQAIKIAYSRYTEEELKIIKELYRKYMVQ